MARRLTRLAVLLLLRLGAAAARDLSNRRNRTLTSAKAPRLASIVLLEPRVDAGVAARVLRVIGEFADEIATVEEVHWWTGPGGGAYAAKSSRKIVVHETAPPPTGPFDDVRRWYNRRVAAADLWAGLPPTHALVVQHDAGVCGGGRGWDDAWLAYDFIGARNGHGRLNGGLSVRNVETQRAQNERLRDRSTPSDGGATNEDTRLYEYCAASPTCRLPPPEIADAFALEAPPAGDACPAAAPWAYHKAYALRCRRELRDLCPGARWRWPPREGSY